MIGRRVIGHGMTAGAIGTLCVVVSGLGIAAAANGGSLTLGRHNTATSTTTLEDGHGTPLSLIGKASKPPLKVNSSKQVRHLNASLLGGLSASQLSSGSAKATAPEVGSAIGTSEATATLVISTAPLRAGTYYVNAVAVLDAATNQGAFCFVAVKTTTPTGLQFGGNFVQGLETATEALPVVVHAGGAVAEYCYDNASNVGSSLFSAGITAIKVGHSAVGSAPAVARRRPTRAVSTSGR